jgi:mRNA interferase RelE/StbE
LTYSVGLTKLAAKELAGLPAAIIDRLDRQILALAEIPRPSGCKKLKGRFTEGYRVRVGDYRILYLIDDQQHTVSIYRIGHRRDVYE